MLAKLDKLGQVRWSIVFKICILFSYIFYYIESVKSIENGMLTDSYKF